MEAFLFLADMEVAEQEYAPAAVMADISVGDLSIMMKPHLNGSLAALPDTCCGAQGLTEPGCTTAEAHGAAAGIRCSVLLGG